MLKQSTKNEMKNNLQNAKRWLVQAEFDFNQAKKLFGENNFSYTCFFAEQSAQKSLKAFLLYKDKRFVTIHSVGVLLEEAAKLEESFIPFIDEGKRLDRHYIASRYPDALPEPAIPAESYVWSEAKEALTISGEILKLTQKIIGK